MKKNNTESKLRKVAHEQMDNPPPFVWENIEEELHPKESKRRIGFWWFGSGILLTALIVALIFIINDQDKSDISMSASQSELEKTNKIDESITSETTKEKDNNRIALINKIDEDNKSSESSIANNIFERNVSMHEDNTTTKEINSNNSISNSNSTQEKENKNNRIVEVINVKATPINSLSEEKTLLEKEENRLAIYNQSLATLEVKRLFYDRKKLTIPKIPTFENKMKFSPFAEVGILGGNHQINLSQGQEPALYNLRNNSENTWYSIGFYGNFGLNISNNWNVSVGAEWTMSKNKFENRKEGITKMIVTFDPSSGSAIDTSFISGTLIDKGDITLHFIDIPLSVGYTVSKNRWHYGVEVTGILNLKTIAEGKLLSNNEGGIMLNGQESIYKKSVGLGLRGSLVFGTKINDSYTLQVKPSFKTYLNTINDSDYPLPTDYNLFSVSVGLRKEF